MLLGISIFCFVASYTVALALEATRLWFKSGVRGAVMVGFAAAGLLAHTLYLAHNGYTEAKAGITPLSSSSEYYLLGAWVLVVAYFYATFTQPRIPSGIFLLPLALLLIGAATLVSREPFPQERAAQIWGGAHGIFLLTGYVAVACGFVVGIMYLLQAARLKAKQLPAEHFRLPSLEWLDTANHRAIVGAAILVTVGVLSGAILNLVQVEEIRWNDPVVLRSTAMVVWLAAAALFSAYYKPAQQGRKVAYLTVASFVFLVLSVIAGLILETEHKSKSPPVVVADLSVESEICHVPAIQQEALR